MDIEKIDENSTEEDIAGAIHYVSAMWDPGPETGKELNRLRNLLKAKDYQEGNACPQCAAGTIVKRKSEFGLFFVCDDRCGAKLDIGKVTQPKDPPIKAVSKKEPPKKHNIMKANAVIPHRWVKKKLSGGAFRVLITLLAHDYRDKTIKNETRNPIFTRKREVWIAITTMMAETGLSKSGVKEGIKHLVKAGIITKGKKYKNKNLNKYSINYDAI